ncbi:MAG: Rpn family recombination-promoting nuclease/putative transposase, partial [Planctomycetaceae bacterium]|nr:Rpn family recombination-promoting nuclease/putative transposase [Planctomycetaceae bacterium]
FTKTESELETHRDKWIYFLKNLMDFDEIPAILNEPVFERAFTTAEVARMSKLEYERYDRDRMIYWDNNAAIYTAEYEGHEAGLAKGLAEGMEIGMEKGVEIGKIEIARNMKKEGFDVSMIVKMTGLSPDEIERLD